MFCSEWSRNQLAERAVKADIALGAQLGTIAIQRTNSKAIITNENTSIHTFLFVVWVAFTNDTT